MSEAKIDDNYIYILTISSINALVRFRCSLIAFMHLFHSSGENVNNYNFHAKLGSKKYFDVKAILHTHAVRSF